MDCIAFNKASQEFKSGTRKQMEQIEYQLSYLKETASEITD